MSRTQMDLSPLVIDRKQDIASWPEGDIDQLAARDKNRYQKRKSAIIEYFESDHSVEEISAHHHLSAIDALEVMVRRCCTLHKDGRPWGFRALVPGANVVVPRVTPVASTSSQQTRSAETKTPLRARLSPANADATQVQVASEDKDGEDTSEHQAVARTKLTELPQTPMPASLQEHEEPGVIRARINLSGESADEEKEDALFEDEVKQEEFPATTRILTETGLEEEVVQEAFPTLASGIETIGDEEVEQEAFSGVVAAESAEEKTEQEEPPSAISTVEEITVEEKQGEFPSAASVANEASVEEKTEPEEFPSVESIAEEASVEEEEEVAQEEFPTLAVESGSMEDEEVKQEEFPHATNSVEEARVEEEQEKFPASVSAVQISKELELVEDDDEDLEGEPTGKLSVVRPEAPERTVHEESEPVDSTLAAQDDKETAENSVQAVREQVGEFDGTEAAELDTMELERVVAEDRLNRVAAAETIVIPAAMLDALEKADQALPTSEPAVASVVPGEKKEATTEDRTVAIPPAHQDLEEMQSPEDEALARNDVSAIPTQTLEAWRRDSRQLTQAPAMKSPTQSLTEESRYRITGSQVAIKHSVLRRWGKQGRLQRHQQWVRIISAAIVVSILVILLIPLGVGLVGYNAYTNIKNVADDGVNNLLSLQALIPANKNDITSALNTQKLNTAKTNLQKAQSDFLQLQDMVNRPDIESLLQQFAPQYSSKLAMARRLVIVALDVSRMGQELIGVGQKGATILHGAGSLLSSTSTTPLFSADDINSIEAALVHAQYYIGDIQTQMSQVNLAELPLGSATQKAKLGKYLNEIPQAQSLISQAQTLVGPVAWMLGIGAPRHFLVQTLDRGELRPSGGFEGQYGLLTLQNGHMSPFSLRDITLLDYAENGNELGASPPAQYGWMNFGSFGVRDANLSADYPTTAKIVMNYFQAEGGGPLDGDIQITPVVIEQFLQITGPIQIKDYNETITAQNLENKLHEYQQDPRLIALQQQKTGQDTHATRKAFTNLVGTMLMDRIKHLPPSQMISFGKILLKDFKSRDLQVYLNNPVAEQWLEQNGYSGAMPQFTNGNDGFMVVQSNISISKAAQYVKSTFKDNVSLDASGGATHNLTVTLNYQQNGPVYGFDTYADYMRIYAPANAQLRNAYGFNTGSTLCTPGAPPLKPTTGRGGIGSGKGNGSGTTASSGGGSYTDDSITVTGCGQYYNTFTDTSARSCPDGNYRLGYDGMQSRGWPISNLGGPSETHSDLSGYSLWGGLTLTPKNCITTVTLSWYVPHTVQKMPGQAPYQMIVGHQAGWPDTAQISINASALKGVANLNYNQTIDADTLVALAPLPGQSPQQKPGSGTPTPAITPTSTPKKS